MHNIGHIPLFDIVVFLRCKKLKYLDKTCLTTVLEKGDISVRFFDFDLFALRYWFRCTWAAFILLKLMNIVSYTR